MNNLGKEEFLRILKKHQQGIATPEEEAFLKAYFNIFEHGPDYISTLTTKQQEELGIRLKNKIDKAVNQPVGPLPVPFIKKPNLIWAVVAAVFICISFIVFYSNNKHPAGNPVLITKATIIDVPSGGNRAILTLANGSKISLTDAANGEISNQSGIKITKARDGELIYEVTGSADNELSSLNTIETPRGGQYQINLPDGSRVWLNAESSLKFPVSFVNASQRIVELTGEAYFEVTHNKYQPFIVRSAEQEIEVLGTHFNVNSYKNEAATKTTLLEGTVKVSHNDQSEVIHSGQQTSVKDNISVEQAEDNAIAWKNGITSFNKADIRTIMRQVSRWYDIDVSYEGQIPARLFTGELSRSANLSELIRILESSNIKFKFDKKTITVMP